MTASEKHVLRGLEIDLRELGFEFKDVIKEGIDFGDSAQKILGNLVGCVDYGWKNVGDEEDRPIFKAAHILIGDAQRRLRKR